MTITRLLDFLQNELDYAGTFTEVCARLTDEHIAAFDTILGNHEHRAYLYFGLRRTAVERGSPSELLIRSAKKGGEILTLAIYLIAMERMRRADEITCEFPPSPFASPNADIQIKLTEKGLARRAELEAKESAGLSKSGTDTVEK